MENQEPKQYVTKPLQLNSVPKSENPTDNILVQGTDKIVKFIPRNEFNSGIGEISGTPNSITKFNASGNNLQESAITEEIDRILINKSVEINSQLEGESGLKFSHLKNENKTLSEIVYDQDVTPSAGFDGTAYFPWGNIVKKVNLDKTITDFYTFPEGCFVQAKIIVSPNNGDLFAIYFDGVSSYKLVKFDESGILSVLKSSILGYSYLDHDKNDNIYVEEHSTQKILRINAINSNEKQYYTGNLSLGVLGFDLESNGYFYDNYNRNLIYKINPDGIISNFATLSFEIGTGCVKDDGSLYITAYNEDDKNIYSVGKDGNTIVVFTTLSYKSYEPYISENGFLYVHNNNYDNGLVYKISPTGQVSLLGSAGNSPRYMAVTRLGVVYISNSASYNLIKISSQEEEKLLTLDENGNVILSSKEVISAADFKTINGKSILGSGNILIESEGNQDLDKTLLNGNVTNNDIIQQRNNFDESYSYSNISTPESIALQEYNIDEESSLKTEIDYRGINISNNERDTNNISTKYIKITKSNNGYPKSSILTSEQLTIDETTRLTTEDGQEIDAAYYHTDVSKEGLKITQTDIENGFSSQTEIEAGSSRYMRQSVYDPNNIITYVGPGEVSVNKLNVGTFTGNAEGIEIINYNFSKAAIVQNDKIGFRKPNANYNAIIEPDLWSGMVANKLPTVSGTLANSVNGIIPDATGNITIPSLGSVETTLYHKLPFLDKGTISNTGIYITGEGTSFDLNDVGSKIVKENGETAIIATVTNELSITTVEPFKTNSPSSTYKVYHKAYELLEDGSTNLYHYNRGFSPTIKITADNTVRLHDQEFKPNGNVQGINEWKFGNTSLYDDDIKLFKWGGLISSSGPHEPTDIGFKRHEAGIWEINNGTPENYADLILRKMVMTAASYSNDASADADATLPSGGLYTVNGDRTVRRKP